MATAPKTSTTTRPAAAEDEAAPAAPEGAVAVTPAAQPAAAAPAGPAADPEVALGDWLERKEEAVSQKNAMALKGFEKKLQAEGRTSDTEKNYDAAWDAYLGKPTG